jgi:hypothetical protein
VKCGRKHRRDTALFHRWRKEHQLACYRDETKHVLSQFKEVHIDVISYRKKKFTILFQSWINLFRVTSFSLIYLNILQLVCMKASYQRIRGSRGSAVGIATGYGLDDRGVGVRVPVRSRTFTSSSSARLWGPPNILSNGYRGPFSPGIKWHAREAGHSPPTSAEVKKTWIYTSTPVSHKSSWHIA